MNLFLLLIMILHIPIFILDMIKLIYICFTTLLISLFSKDDDSKKYVANNLLAIDQSINTEAGGSYTETCSSRLGRYEKTVWIARLICKLINLIDKDHCQKMILPDVFRNDEIIT